MVHVKLQMQPPGMAVGTIGMRHEDRLRHGAEGLQQGGIHQRELAGQLPEQLMPLDPLHLPRQLLHHFLQHLRFEDPATLAETAQGKAFDP